MTPAPASAGSAKVERIRHAQLWEDADVLTDALGSERGQAAAFHLCGRG